MALHLPNAGATVDIAENGRIAFEMLLGAQDVGTPYALLLTDMQMPEMDGYTLARTLQERGSLIAIAALTAHSMADDRTRCMDAGCWVLGAGCMDYASKPINKAALLAACAQWMGTRVATKVRLFETAALRLGVASCDLCRGDGDGEGSQKRVNA